MNSVVKETLIILLLGFLFTIFIGGLLYISSIEKNVNIYINNVLKYKNVNVYECDGVLEFEQIRSSSFTKINNDYYIITK